ncbi:MAG TPA: glycolate oxidase subunit GlcF [Steroidobacteraceae bacterium]|nr:glycolate oxidase subunit GlcF [Steroidobacteraceae bacterium]
METRLADWIRDTPEGRDADAILRACVHCGFCTATCPTYQLLGDELDGPRGRIYQIKQVLEGAPPTRSTQLHLDRCLTCLGCETTCPSGVRYGRLLEIGRHLVDERVPRPPGERLARAALRAGLSRPALFGLALALGRALRPLLPAALRAKVLARRAPGRAPARGQARRVLLLTSCTQGALLPAVDRAAQRVLAALGVEAGAEPRAGCCGAVRAHLGDPDGGLAAARRNVDAWSAHLDAGVEALVMTASGCGIQVKDYGRLLAAEPAYAERARQVSARTFDLAEWLGPEAQALAALAAAPAVRRVAFHAPCTLQHGQRVRGRAEAILEALGAELVPVRDAHLCCGSAGAYSLLQPALSSALRERKLAGLTAGAPAAILSANVGCLAHLAAGTPLPVRHWIEWVDALIEARRAAAPPAR